MVAFTERYYGASDVLTECAETSFTLRNYKQGFYFYLVWQALYLFAIGVVMRTKLKKDPEYLFLYSKKPNIFYIFKKCLLCIQYVNVVDWCIRSSGCYKIPMA